MGIENGKMSSHTLQHLDTIDDETNPDNWKMNAYDRPRTVPGMVSLFWKCFERETENGHLV